MRVRASRGGRPVRLLLLVLLTLASPVGAESVECNPGETFDVVSYDWKLKGLLSFVAGLKFPTSGNATLATVHRAGGKIAETELRILAGGVNGDRYRYRSVIDVRNQRTTESIDGYHFDGRTRSDTTTFDYTSGKARRVRSDSKKGKGETVRFENFSGSSVKDVLTSIEHIRQSADGITKPQRHGVYAGGTVYEVLITPGATKTFVFQGRSVKGKHFAITSTPENRDQWPGDVSVWITLDKDRIPLEIDLGKSMASLRLQAVSRFTCP